MEDTTAAARPGGAAVFWRVFLPFAFGHFLSSLLRNVNAVLAPQLAGELSLSPGELGLLTSLFFCAFALAQLPVGVALDRYGPRRVQGCMLLAAALATLMFARAGSIGALAASRFVMGLALGGCFMAAVKAMAACSPSSRMPSISGYLIAAGGLGSAASTLPVRAALATTGWRGIFVVLALATCACAFLVWCCAPRDAPRPASQARRATLSAVYADPAFRRIVSLVLVPHTVFFGVQGLWIGRWLSDVGRFREPDVAYLLYLSMAAVIFGAIAVGMITEWAGSRGIPPLQVAAWGIGLFLLVQLAIVADLRIAYRQLAVLFTLVGTITGLEYALVAQSMPRALTGRASTCLNLLIFVGAFLVQAGFGLIVGLWDPDPLGHYPAAAYRTAFGVLVLLQAPGLVRCLLRDARERAGEQPAVAGREARRAAPR